jgi:hypothetical protein
MAPPTTAKFRWSEFTRVNYGLWYVPGYFFDMVSKATYNWRASHIGRIILGIVIVIGDLLKYPAKNDLYQTTCGV